MNEQNKPASNGKVLCIIGMILGIYSFVEGIFCLIPIINMASIWNLAVAIVGLVLSSMGKKKALAAGASTGMATVGLVFSIIAIVFSGIGFICCIACTGCAACNPGALEDLAKSLS